MCNVRDWRHYTHRLSFKVMNTVHVGEQCTCFRFSLNDTRAVKGTHKTKREHSWENVQSVELYGARYIISGFCFPQKTFRKSNRETVFAIRWANIVILGRQLCMTRGKFAEMLKFVGARRRTNFRKFRIDHFNEIILSKKRNMRRGWANEQRKKCTMC